LTAETCVHARWLLNWSQTDLASWSGLTWRTITNFESGRHQPRYETVTALLRAFRRNGIEFVLTDGEPGCVRLQKIRA
jgi:DNA-binding XRE family transcriptional regulator